MCDSILHQLRAIRAATPALFLVLVGVLSPVDWARAADEIHWTVMGQNAVSFDWRGSESTIEYGTSPGNYTGSATAVTPSPLPNSSSGPFREARITGLAENTLYYYRIGSGPEHTFRTPPPRGSADFWVAAFADIGSSLSYSGVAPTMAQLAADNAEISGDDRPRFVLVPGDLTYGDQHDASHVDQHFNDAMPWSRDAAYMPAWGNHEWGSSIDDLQNYEGRFDLPNTQTSPNAPSTGGPGDDWYWFDYGNARFIAFPEPYSGAWSDWVTKVTPVMAAAQNDPAIRFIVTFGHRPAWSSGSDHGSETSLSSRLIGLKANFPKLLLNINGHSHHYERSDPAQTEGITSIVSGGGGSATGGLASSQPSWSVYRIDHFAHVRLHFRADRIDGYAVCGPSGGGADDTCTKDTVIDTWTIFAEGGPIADEVPPSPPRELRTVVR